MRATAWAASAYAWALAAPGAAYDAVLAAPQDLRHLLHPPLVPGRPVQDPLERRVLASLTLGNHLETGIIHIFGFEQLMGLPIEISINLLSLKQFIIRIDPIERWLNGDRVRP